MTTKGTVRKKTSGKPPKVKSVGVLIKTWWDKRHGNTYNSVDLLVNGELAQRFPFSYGGDSIAQDRAVEWLVRGGHLKVEEYQHGGYPPLRRLAADLKFALHVDVSQVPREKDLYHEPKPLKR